MASLEVAIKANATIVLPALLVVLHLEMSNLLPPAAKDLHQDSSLPNKTAICLRLENGENIL